MIRSTLTAVSALLVAGAAHAAPVTIDDFSTTGNNVVAPVVAPASQTSTSGVTVAASAFGGNRTVTAERTVPGLGTSNGLQVEGRVDPVAETASVSLSSGAEGFVTFDWTSVSPVDFIDGTNSFMAIDVLAADQFITYSLSVNGVTSSTTGVADAVAHLVPSFEETLQFDFSSFAGVDFAAVTSVSLTIALPGVSAWDTTIDGVFADGNGVIPLPAAGFLAIGGLGALGALRARRKS